MTRKTAAEIIAFHFGNDIADVRDSRYQPTRLTDPAVYVIGNDYFAAPSNNAPPRHDVGLPWEAIGEHYGRKVYRARMSAG